MKLSKIATYLIIYGLCHALVDACCIMLILGAIDVRTDLLYYVLLYNILAFGLQLPFGWITDRIHKPVSAAILGCLSLSIALPLYFKPLIAVILAGIGNALFHVGGGTVSLNLRPGKASLPGVFVAPGGLGLFFGVIISGKSGFHPWLFVAILMAMVVLLFIVKSPVINYKTLRHKNANILLLIIFLIMLSICIRSAIGLTIDFAWRTKVILALTFAISIAFGKGIGGFLADYFGWIRISIGGLILSALLLFYGTISPLAGITGIFLFNLTMPVTLVAISNLLPGRPGFSFGISTFALLIGALPSFFNVKQFLEERTVMLLLIFFSAAILFFALKKYYKIHN